MRFLPIFGHFFLRDPAPITLVLNIFQPKLPSDQGFPEDNDLFGRSHRLGVSHGKPPAPRKKVVAKLANMSFAVGSIHNHAVLITTNLIYTAQMYR